MNGKFYAIHKATSKSIIHRSDTASLPIARDLDTKLQRKNEDALDRLVSYHLRYSSRAFGSGSVYGSACRAIFWLTEKPPINEIAHGFGLELSPVLHGYRGNSGDIDRLLILAKVCP